MRQKIISMAWKMQEKILLIAIVIHTLKYLDDMRVSKWGDLFCAKTDDVDNSATQVKILFFIFSKNKIYVN